MRKLSPIPVVVLCLTCWCFVAWSSKATGADSLHDRIDAMIAAAAGGELGARSDDAEFMRRVSLDLGGQIPTSAEVRKFLDDPSPDKRTELIDRLLESPQYSQRMTDLFNIMLIERRSKHAEWLKFLRDSFASNKPWDQMTREILAPQADEESTRGSALFYTARLEHIGQNPPDVPGLVRDVGRLFLGVDVQCAQCHDHLTVDDYKQVDYQGLYAFVSTVTLRPDLKFPAVAESPLTKRSPTSRSSAVKKRRPGRVCLAAWRLNCRIFAKETNTWCHRTKS